MGPQYYQHWNVTKGSYKGLWVFKMQTRGNSGLLRVQLNLTALELITPRFQNPNMVDDINLHEPE